MNLSWRSAQSTQPPPHTSISSPLHLLPPFSILIRTVRSANPPTVETWKRYTDYAPGIASFCPIPRAQLKILSHQWLQGLHILVMDPIMLMKAIQKAIITDTIGNRFIFTLYSLQFLFESYSPQFNGVSLVCFSLFPCRKSNFLFTFT